ncbi:MAG TPA: hypothetical protein VGU43_05235, partial [Thermoplasmata archaeon]|nr:hypothetical protein [Thermoplasmata archaeon]
MPAPPNASPEEVDPWEASIESVLVALAPALARRGLAIPDPELRQELQVATGGPADMALALHRFARQANRTGPELASELATELPQP